MGPVVMTMCRCTQAATEVPGPGALTGCSMRLQPAGRIRGGTGQKRRQQGGHCPGLYQFADPSSSDWKRTAGRAQRGGDGGSRGDHHQLHPSPVRGQMLHIRGLDLFSAAPNGGKKYGRIHFYDENRQFLAQINPNSFLRW